MAEGPQLRSRCARRGWTAVAGDHNEARSLEASLRRAAQGDEAAFADFYDGTSSRVYGVILRVLRDPAQSEEVAQEVFLEVWRHAGRFDAGLGSALAWIMTIAHRRAVDRVRSEQSSRDRTLRVAVEVAPPYDEVAASVEQWAEHDRVTQALSALTDLQRQAIDLAYYGGYTYRQVAELLDAPLGTIKTRLRDGLLRLQAELGQL